MMTDNKKQISITVECYDYDSAHQILVARSREARSHFFFYLPRLPAIDFGDRIQMNFADDLFYVRKGNSRLTYKLSPQPFPGTLLLELITEYLSQ